MAAAAPEYHGGLPAAPPASPAATAPWPYCQRQCHHEPHLYADGTHVCARQAGQQDGYEGGADDWMYYEPFDYAGPEDQVQDMELYAFDVCDSCEWARDHLLQRRKYGVSDGPIEAAGRRHWLNTEHSIIPAFTVVLLLSTCLLLVIAATKSLPSDDGASTSTPENTPLMYLMLPSPSPKTDSTQTTVNSSTYSDVTL